jgi:predicted nucleic acid-binding protein
MAVMRLALIDRSLQDVLADYTLAAAVAAKADLLVSGDRHLLALGTHDHIHIVTPAEAVRLIATP